MHRIVIGWVFTMGATVVDQNIFYLPQPGIEFRLLDLQANTPPRHCNRDGRGLILWLFVAPTGVYLLDFFCSGIQSYLLLSHYLCFISLLYLDLYVLGDDALIS